MIHNFEELEENEEIELQLADQELIVNGKLNETDDILFNKEIKNKFERDFYKKQMMLENVRFFIHVKIFLIDLINFYLKNLKL